MLKRQTSVLVLGAALVLSTVAWRTYGARKTADSLTVHEWGTFTSIAGKQGVSVEWRPLAGKSDLPSFVYQSADAVSGKGFRSGQEPALKDEELTPTVK